MGMQLHLNAAYIRRNSPIKHIAESTMTDCAHYTTCGRCHRGVLATGTPQSSGIYAFCERCSDFLVTCSIWYVYAHWPYKSCRAISNLLPNSHLPVRKMLILCHGCGHGGHKKCYHNFYKLQPPVDLSSAEKRFPFIDRESINEDQQHQKRRTRSAVQGIEEDSTPPVRRESSVPGGLSRGRRKDSKKGTEDGDNTILEVTRPSTREHSASNEKIDPNAKRARSEAETETIVEEDSGIPDEEYLLVREKEAQKRATAIATLKLLGHRCAAGCGHLCWMTRV